MVGLMQRSGGTIAWWRWSHEPPLISEHGNLTSQIDLEDGVVLPRKANITSEGSDFAIA